MGKWFMAFLVFLVIIIGLAVAFPHFAWMLGIVFCVIVAVGLLIDRSRRKKAETEQKQKNTDARIESASKLWSNVGALKLKAEGLTFNVRTKAVAKLTWLNERFKHSRPITHPSLAEIDEKINAEVAELDQLLDKMIEEQSLGYEQIENAANKISVLLDERIVQYMKL